MKKLFLVVLVGAMAATMSSCAAWKSVKNFHFGFGKKSAKEAPAVETVAVPSVTDREAELRKAAQRDIETASSGSHEQVLFRRPYYLKEYSVYADPGTLDVALRENDSRSQPLAAEVKISKERYFTKMRKERREVRDDKDFFRDSGVETATYMLRNGRWRRTGSVFVAEKTEMNRDGQWLPVDETTEVQTPKEENRPGWFKRQWRWLTGK